MIVVEFDYIVENSGDISMDIFVIGHTQDKNGMYDKVLFEKTIIPQAKMSMPQTRDVQEILNSFIKVASVYKYRLKRINSKDANPINFQLEFYSE